MSFRTALFTLAAAAAVATASQQKKYHDASCVDIDCLAPAEPRESEITRCMAFLDVNREAWNVESTNVTALEENCRHGLPTVQVMRLAKEYVCTYEGKKAPFLRIVAFLPHVETNVVYDQVANVQRRLAWDFNYQMFEAAPAPSGLPSSTPSMFIEVERPWWHAVSSYRQCVDGVCSRVADSTCTRFESRWFVHRLGSAFLSKLGVAERFFAYQRDSFAYRPSLPHRSITAFDILYSGAPDVLRAIKTTDPDVKAFLEAKEAEVGNVTPVLVNYQHIMLVPITSVKDQLLAEDRRGWERLSHTASLVDTDSTQILHDCLLESNHLAQLGETQEANVSGTLFMITSANCASVPAAMPMWVQRKISSAVASNTYATLQKACVAETAQTTPPPPQQAL